MVQRRAYLKSAGSIAAISALGVTNVTATPSHDNLRKRFRDAFQQDGPSGVKKEVEELGVAYDQGVDKVRSDGDLSRNNHYAKGEADLSVLTLPASGDDDQIHVFVQMQFGGHALSTRSPCYIDDVIGFGFNDSHWSVVGEPHIAATKDNEIDFYSGSVESGGTVAGVNIKIAHPNHPPADAYVELSGVLENLDGVAGTIWGHYEHTFSRFGGGAIESVTAGPSAFEITLSGGSTAWYAAKPSDPSGALD